MIDPADPEAALLQNGSTPLRPPPTSAEIDAMLTAYWSDASPEWLSVDGYIYKLITQPWILPQRLRSP